MINPKDVMLLREKTGVGMMECKKALGETNGDMEKAIEFLRKKGLASASKKEGRTAAEGLIQSYVHDGRIGVMVEVNCETDFVGKNKDFIEFSKDIAMHIAASDPKFIKAEDMDENFKKKEAEIYAAQLKEQGKPDAMIAKIVDGKLAKLAEETCLYEQKFVKNPDITVKDLMNELVLKLGEKIVVRRFVKYNLGEGIDKKTGCFAEEVAMMSAKKQ
jgi:elongation factor Ts